MYVMPFSYTLLMSTVVLTTPFHSGFKFSQLEMSTRPKFYFLNDLLYPNLMVLIQRSFSPFYCQSSSFRCRTKRLSGMYPA